MPLSDIAAKYMPQIVAAAILIGTFKTDISYIKRDMDVLDDRLTKKIHIINELHDKLDNIENRLIIIETNDKRANDELHEIKSNVRNIQKEIVTVQKEIILIVKK